ncbi:MAG: hypothetical protein IJX40_00615, partial [Alistipes sp.]|nr:hypothetical protein [Alistipes sp.]
VVPAVYEKYYVILSIPVELNSSQYKDSNFIYIYKNLPNKKLVRQAHFLCSVKLETTSLESS